jgi:selenocysteine lyase/cysteine desulfurase
LSHSEFVQARSSFPGAALGPYLDTAARGLMPAAARAALDRMLDQHLFGTLDKAAAFDKVEETRALFAALIKCSPDEVAFTRNVTDGIAAFATALPWREGDNVVVCDTLEHPANLYPWYGLGPKFGVRVKTVPQQDGAIPLDGIVDAIDTGTRVVTVSTVSFAPGFRFPVAELGRQCRERGVLLCVDAAQSIGVIQTDVTAMQVDALAASTQKGLMTLYGCGFLYVRQALADTLNPAYVSRFGVDLGAQHEAAAGDAAAYQLARGARRFDVGNFNYTAVAAVAESLKLLLDLGPQQVEQRVCGLAHQFAARMTDLGLPVFGGVSNQYASHIVTIGHKLGAEHDASADMELSGLYQYLTANGVRLTVRRDLLRFSFHLYNNDDDVDRVVALCRDWLQRGLAAQR